jgi:hypothetical protein
LARGAELRIYGEVPYGKLANLYLLDDRQYRDRQVCNKGFGYGSGWVDPDQCEEWLDPQRSLLGPQQEQWLNQSFANARNDGRVVECGGTANHFWSARLQNWVKACPCGTTVGTAIRLQASAHDAVNSTQRLEKPGAHWAVMYTKTG